MKTSFMALAIVVYGMQCHAQHPVQPMGYTIIRPCLTVPDSLGGAKLRGYARFQLHVHHFGTILNSSLERLVVGSEGTELVTVFKDTMYMPCNTPLQPWSDEAKRFMPWLWEYLARTQFRFCDDPDDPYTAGQRRHLISYDIYFNPKIEELQRRHGFE
jgi:hypothetical protein